VRLALTLFFAFFTLSSTRAEVNRVLRLFEIRYGSAHTLQAAFLERYTENGHLVRVESGAAYFRRPGKMRWEYESPEKNLFLVDGKTAWFYVPADHTVTRVPAKESTDWRTPLALLAGEMKLSRVCARVEPARTIEPKSPNNAVFVCQLRGVQRDEGRPATGQSSEQSESGEAVFFEIVKNSGDLVRVVVRYPGGVTIDFHFANWQTDSPVPDSLFRFEPPRGVAIVNGELPQAGIGLQR
jgi:outer membrane lipoprotein carrier protein